jgi:hypothetical protein
MKLTVRGSIVFFASFWITANAMAADPAPLPDGFPGDPTTTLPGVFASAVYYESQYDHMEALKKLDAACIARGRLVERVGTQDDMLTTWWLYRTMTETAVFRRKVTAKLDYDACRVTYGEQREIFRSVEKAGEWPSPFAGQLRCSSFAKNCHSLQMLGVRARCRVEGNVFQLSRDCVSIERGPTRGLLLEAVYQSDDMSGSGFEVRELKIGVPLDASVFDRTRTW